ncbi:hypothetical protein DFP73DRAFT_540744 [Morchella snyderi]|nr:hypothetical protein DFP73DRAFT_540744 [Morchella snyderi]
MCDIVWTGVGLACVWGGWGSWYQLWVFCRRAREDVWRGGMEGWMWREGCVEGGMSKVKCSQAKQSNADLSTGSSDGRGRDSSSQDKAFVFVGDAASHMDSRCVVGVCGACVCVVCVVCSVW